MRCPFSAADSPVPQKTTADSDVSQSAQLTPGPAKPVSIESNVDPLAFLSQMVDQYGDVVRYQTRFGQTFLFIHPEHVQTILHRENYRRASLVKMMLGNGLLTTDGPQWRSVRKLMQRDFLPAAVAPFSKIISSETDRTATAWRTSAAEPVDITTAMTRLTLRIVLKTLFSTDLTEARSVELCTAFTDTIKSLGRLSSTVFGVPVQFTPETTNRFTAGKKIVDATCYHIIAARRAVAPADRPPDLLTLLLETATDPGPFDDTELRDEIVTMIIGGHETTALALAWAWKAIGEHPEVETALHDEVDTVLAGRSPEHADVAKLTYTRAVFQETMRLYPPVWYMARVANEDDIIHGHAVPKGACVLVSAWLTHRHREFWPEPQRFDPSRFVSTAAPAEHRYAYFPFGGGRHTCLGMHFAMMEGTMILAHLAQQFRVQPVAGQTINPDPGITLRQSPGMMVKVIARPAKIGRSRAA